VEGNLAKLNKLVRKGKTDADVLEDRLQKARSALTAPGVCRHAIASTAPRLPPCRAAKQRCIYAVQVSSRLLTTMNALRRTVSRIGRRARHDSWRCSHPHRNLSAGR